MTEASLQTPETAPSPEQVAVQADTVSRAIVERMVPAIAGLDPNARAKAVRDVAIIGSNSVTGVYFLLAAETPAGRVVFEASPEAQELIDTIEADAAEIAKTQVDATAGSDTEVHESEFLVTEQDLLLNKVLKIATMGGKRPASQSVAVMRTDQYIEMAHASHSLIAEIIRQNPDVIIPPKFQKLMEENLAIAGDYYE